MIERGTVVKFGVNQGGANDTSSFQVKVIISVKKLVVMLLLFALNRTII